MPKNTSKILIPLATAAVAAAVTVGSGANWSASVPTTTIAGAGTISVDKPGGATLTVSNMKPGDVRTGQLTITNTGSLATDITMNRTVKDTTFADGSLLIQIKRDSTVVYPTDGTDTYGPVGSVPQGLALSTAGAPLAGDDPATAAKDGGQTTLTFAVKLLDGAPASDQGATAHVNYDFVFAAPNGTTSSGTVTPN